MSATPSAASTTWLCLSYSAFFFFSSRRRHTRYWRDWSSDVCSSDLWDLASGTLRATHKTPNQWMDALSVSADGKRAVTASASFLHLWDVDFLHQEQIGRASCRERV